VFHLNTRQGFFEHYFYHFFKKLGSIFEKISLFRGKFVILIKVGSYSVRLMRNQVPAL